MWTKIKTFFKTHWVSLTLVLCSLFVLAASLWIASNPIALDMDVDVEVDAVMKNSSLNIPK